MCPRMSGALVASHPARVLLDGMTRQIRFNAFDMNCVAHQSSGLWRHPDDRSRQYNTISYWTDLAKLLESATFDGIFIADVLGTYDVYGGTNEAAIRNGAQVPVERPDPSGQRDGRGHRAPRLRHHGRHGLRAPLPVRASPQHPRPSDQRTCRLERRDRLPAQRRAQHGSGGSARARRPLRPRRRVRRGALQALGGVVGR